MSLGISALHLAAAVRDILLNWRISLGKGDAVKRWGVEYRASIEMKGKGSMECYLIIDSRKVPSERLAKLMRQLEGEPVFTRWDGREAVDACFVGDGDVHPHVQRAPTVRAIQRHSPGRAEVVRRGSILEWVPGMKPHRFLAESHTQIRAAGALRAEVIVQ